MREGEALRIAGVWEEPAMYPEGVINACYNIA